MRVSVCLSVLILVSLTSGCATQDQSRVTDAAATPLNDLNLVHSDIPPLLLEAQKAPYAIPAAQTCTALMDAIEDLDAVLGPDLDAPTNTADGSQESRGAKESKNLVVGALRRTAEGVVPFRGWVRKLTGAERHSKKVEATIHAGTVRRAFLKGLKAARDCTA